MFLLLCFVYMVIVELKTEGQTIQNSNKNSTFSWVSLMGLWTTRPRSYAFKPWPNGPASSRKLNLRRDLRWVAKRPASFFASIRKSHKKTFYGRLSSISLANNRLMDITQLSLTLVGWSNGEKLASTCVQIWCRPKWAQVNASARKPWPNEVASWPKSSTCVKLRRRLARALSWTKSIY